ncbi:MAG: response regulator transcription factor [Acidobacteriota bacterium]|nr:response regulator transcription factor [Acidobacteriota bacterium]
MKRAKPAKPAKRAKRTAKRPGGGLDWVKRGRMPSVTILIADSEKSSRAAATRAIQSLRGMRVVGEAGTGIEAVSMTGRLKPRVVLLDLNLSSEFGASLISVLRRKSARTRVILLVGRVSEARMIEALSHGAVGCVTKKDMSRFLPEALEAVASGEAWMSRKLIPKIMDRLAAFTALVESSKR